MFMDALSVFDIGSDMMLLVAPVSQTTSIFFFFDVGALFTEQEISLVCDFSFTILILCDFICLDFFFVLTLSFEDSLLVLLPVVYVLELREVSPDVLKLFDVFRDPDDVGLLEVFRDLDVVELFEVLRNLDLDL